MEDSAKKNEKGKSSRKPATDRAFMSVTSVSVVNRVNRFARFPKSRRVLSETTIGSAAILSTLWW